MDEVEWDRNGQSCYLCATAFSRLLKRRHHCRSCGRNVCEACSKRKLALPSKESRSSITSTSNNDPVRVCDRCYSMLTKKEEVLSEHIMKRQHELELLMVSSFDMSSAVSSPPSDSLVDVFYLDGSFKTLAYDESTTAADLSSRLYTSESPLENGNRPAQCGIVATALFEVIQDINDTRQYKLIKPDDFIVDIVKIWIESKYKYAKIVLPLYEVPRATASHIAPRMGPSTNSLPVLSATTRSSASFSSLDISNNKPEQGTSVASAPTSENDELVKLQQEVASLRALVAKRDATIDTLSSVLAKGHGGSSGNLLDTSKTNVDLSTPFDDDSADYDSDDDVSVLSPRKTSPLPPSSSKPRKSLSGMIFGSSKLSGSGSKSGVKDGKNKAASSRPMHISPERERDSEGFKQQQQASEHQHSSIAAAISASSLSSSSTSSSTSTSSESDPTSAQSQSPSSSHLEGLTSLCSMDSEEFNLFLRSYYFKIQELEQFLAKYDQLFRAVLCSDVVRAESAEDPLSARIMVHVYHMVVAQDGLYTYLITLQERWHSLLKTWLLRAFKQCTHLPVQYPRKLSASIYCLRKERMIIGGPGGQAPSSIQALLEVGFSGELMRIVSASIHEALQRGVDPTYSFSSFNPVLHVGSSSDNSGAYYFKGVAQFMSNVTQTFDWIIGDFTTNIPDELCALPFFYHKTTEIVREEIYPCFDEHRKILKNHELMTMYSFLARLKHLLVKFPFTPEEDTGGGADSRNSSVGTGVGVGSYVAETDGDGAVELLTEQELADWKKEVLKQFNATTALHCQAEMEAIHASDEVVLTGVAAALQHALASWREEEKLTSSLSSSSVVMPAGNHSAAIQSQGSNLLPYSRLFLSNWPHRLSSFIQQQLGLIPNEIDALVKVYTGLQVLEPLMEFCSMQLNWLQQRCPTYTASGTGGTGAMAAFSSSKASGEQSTVWIERLCVFINNQHTFIFQLNETVEKFAYELDDTTATKISQKLKGISTQFLSNALNAEEQIVAFIDKDIQRILRHDLFQHAWRDDVIALTSVQSQLKDHVRTIHTALSPVIADSVDVGRRVDYSMCHMVTKTYTELFLRSGSGGGGGVGNDAMVMDGTTVSRLNEDLEIITRFFEELREEDETAAKINEDVSSAALVLNKAGSILGAAAHRDGRQRRSVDSGKAAKKCDVGRTSSARSPDWDRPSLSRYEEDYEEETVVQRKARVERALKPLQDLVLALQMDLLYLPEFVRGELCVDFGEEGCLQVWQVIMHWRGQEMGAIVKAYVEHFSKWRCPQSSAAPLVDVSGYIGKVKAAGVVKVVDVRSGS